MYTIKGLDTPSPSSIKNISLSKTIINARLSIFVNSFTQLYKHINKQGPLCFFAWHSDVGKLLRKRLVIVAIMLLLIVITMFRGCSTKWNVSINCYTVFITIVRIGSEHFVIELSLNTQTFVKELTAVVDPEDVHVKGLVKEPGQSRKVHLKHGAFLAIENTLNCRCITPVTGLPVPPNISETNNSLYFTR